MIGEPRAESKTLSTLTARLALRGFCLDATDDGPCGSAFRVTGPGGRRTFDSLREVAEFVDRMERAA